MKALKLLMIFLMPLACNAENKSMWLNGGWNALVYNIDSVFISVEDGVTDGCMPQPESVKTTTEAALRRNNFDIVDLDSSPLQGLFASEVKVSTLGYELDSSSCAVVLSINLIKPSDITVPFAKSVYGDDNSVLEGFPIPIVHVLLTGKKSDMQTRIERQVEKGIDKLFIGIDRAKDNVKNEWPKLWEAYSRNAK